MSKREKQDRTLHKRFEEILYVTTVVFAIIIIFVSIILIMRKSLLENKDSPATLSEITNTEIMD